MATLNATDLSALSGDELPDENISLLLAQSLVSVPKPEVTITTGNDEPVTLRPRFVTITFNPKKEEPPCT